MWGNSNVDFVAGNDVGASGGTLLVWDSLVFNKVDTFSSSHFVGVFGKWYGVNETIALVNVYGPQGSRRKDELWRELLSIMSSREAVWILFGDFNAVRSHDERFGTLFVERDVKAFNELINNEGLHELPMGGRRFTRFNREGSKLSKLERYLFIKNKIKKLKLDIKHWWHTKSAEDGAKKKEILARFEQWDTKAELGSLTSFDLLKRDEDLMELQLLVMIVDACNKGIFKGFLGDDGSNISLLQYADDALFLPQNKFIKKQPFGIGIPIDDVASVARVVNCSYDSLPFTYLGLPVRKSMKRVDAWNDVVFRLTKRLAPWKNNLLSIGGRLTLWQKVIADKKDGGLGVGSIKAKNLSLLGKWRWQFLNEKDALWSKVISKIYGSDGGFDVRRGSRQKSSIWGSIIGSCSELNQFDISLSNLIVKKISSGSQTLFWNDSWLKDIGPLKFRFPRLYALDLNKNCSVAERWSKIDDIWQGNWAWRREPSGRALTDLTPLAKAIHNNFSLARQILRLLGGTLGCLERAPNYRVSWNRWIHSLAQWRPS
ncbi:RNA-directed DNA polymerase, eukaryota, reverse transcriptase zinc-binding domain protein [Tanacetum coccineum]